MSENNSKKNKTLIGVIILLGILVAALSVKLYVNSTKEDLTATVTTEQKNKEIDTNIAEVASFTLNACSSCDTAKEDIEKLKKEYPDLKYSSYDIEKDIDILSKYNIQQHPTILFLNKEGLELGRLEKEIDYNKYVEKIKEIETDKPMPVTEYSKTNAAPVSNIATLYLVNKEDKTYYEVKQFIENKSNVKYPKISALKYLLSFNEYLPNDIYNPIPKGVTLENISEVDDVTTISLSKEFESVGNTEDGKRSVDIIANTLFGYDGVKKVQVISGSFKSPILENKTDNISKSKKYSPEIKGEFRPIQHAKEYNLNILYSKEIAFIPCYCGCKEAGHESNHNCYFKETGENEVTIDGHGENCQLCLNVTDKVVKMLSEGRSLKDIRTEIDNEYKDKQSKATDTEMPNM